MITIKRLDHISMAAPSWKEQSARLERLLGFRFLYDFPTGGADFDGSISQPPGIAMEFEVISPAGPESFVQKFLDANGPGLHHITLEVDDITETAAELERLGIRPFGGVSDDGAWKITYIHPRDSGGILWQLFQPYRTHEVEDRRTSGGITGVRRVDHVSLAVPDLERQSAWQQRVLGMEEQGRWRDEDLGYDGCIMSIPGSELTFEIIAPTRPDSFVQKFIDERRAGMHHICVEVASVDAAARALRDEGIEPFGGVIESDWKRHTFLHPRDSGGVLFQLVEEPAGSAK
jgi:methylmalonyl-CoA/ethylmalonyl-CoA epimerase